MVHHVKMSYKFVEHARGCGCVKMLKPRYAHSVCIPAPAIRGAMQWLRRGDRRQVTIDYRYGRIHWEQE